MRGVLADGLCVPPILHAVCKKSGNVANYSYRKNKKKDIVVIGEKDKYEPLSRAVFFKKMKKSNS